MKATINTKSKEKYMAHIPSSELITAAKDLTPKAYQLLMYYYSKGDRWEWDDKFMSDELGLSVRRIKELRQELIKKDYLLILKGPIVTNVFIGRKAVMEFKHPADENGE